VNFRISTYCHIRNGEAHINGELVYQHMGDDSFLLGLYRHLGITYPKFFKMDELSKLAFLGSEMVLMRAEMGQFQEDEIGLLFANQRASLDTDIQYYNTLKQGIPSPALFVYTLPNIGMGEVCICHKLFGENNFLVLEQFDAEVLLQASLPILNQGAAKAMLLAWTENNIAGHDGFFAFITESATLETKEANSVTLAALYLNS